MLFGLERPWKNQYFRMRIVNLTTVICACWYVYVLKAIVRPRYEPVRLIFERCLFLFGNKIHWISHFHI